MSVLPRQLAPAGSPMSIGDVLRWLSTARRWSQVSGELSDVIRSRYGVRHAVLVSTGRAAMTAVLRALRTPGDQHRTEVVLPSYTCYSVAASIVKAGLTPRVVDIDDRTLDYDPQQLRATDLSRTLAIVAPSLYGMPANLPLHEQLCRDHGVALIDDSAQAMGATIDGRSCGTFGDAGLLSFDKGKGVSAIDGGVLLTNSDTLAAAVRKELEPAAARFSASNLVYLAKTFAYAGFLRPSLYAVPSSIPGLGLGVTRYTTEYPVTEYSPLLASLAMTMLPHLDRFVAARTAHARTLLDAVQTMPGVQAITPAATSRPSYVRLPVLTRARTVRDRLLADFRRAGIGATGSYPSAIVDVPELQSIMASQAAPVGRSVSERILTLPTHPYMTPADLRRTAEILRRGLIDDPAGVSAQLATS